MFFRQGWPRVSSTRDSFWDSRAAPGGSAPRLQIYQDSVLDLLGGLQLTQLAANQEYVDTHCQLMSDFRSLKVDYGSDNSITEFPSLARHRGVEQRKMYSNLAGKWKSLICASVEHIVIIEFICRKLVFVFADEIVAQRFLLCMELLTWQAQHEDWRPGAKRLAVLAARAKLAQKFDAVRTGGKGTTRRRKMVKHQASSADEKQLQAHLKRLGLNNIPGIEEVNMFTEDGGVLHFNTPKVQAAVGANTYVISGQPENKRLEELLPGIINQLGADNLMNLRRIAEGFRSAPQEAGDTGCRG
ncbi:Transcription factor BTF3 (Nascent polypeptide-associated complex subunit beta) (NAC-beta) (RNA polymerase B transcription factor 3) [Durusdinium trenchii]|uniref:Nascent polypeptide-associated complex subunit beta n=1 Tax=Durusdinium trenchii TaxID=1381693 RepID=A0ABP0JV66_9DINO